MTTTALWRDTKTDFPTTALRSDIDVDVAVVGAGFTGLITALLLAQEGRRVHVIEAHQVGAGASGATTGKATLLQGTRLSDLRDAQDTQFAAEYLAANRIGFDWLRQFCTEHNVTFDNTSAFTFASSDDGIKKVRAEHELALELGLRTILHDPCPKSFITGPAVELPDQFQLDPVDLLLALAHALVGSGGSITEHTRVTSVEPSEDAGQTTLRAGDHTILADQVVLATAAPITHRITTMKLVAERSYLCAYDFPVGTDVPEGMWISAESPATSFRTARAGEHARLIVGGQRHRTGITGAGAHRLDRLDRWTTRHFGNVHRTHGWSAQDFHPIGWVPRVETLPWGEGRAHFAGGYSKWGLTSAPAAAQALVDLVLGRSPSVDFGTPTSATSVKGAAGVHAETATNQLSNLTRSLTGWDDDRGNAPDDSTTTESAAHTHREGIHLVGEALIDDTPHRVSLICPHMGGTLAWNEVEESWDCPLHGSRFSADGTLLEGPAVEDLTTRD